MIKRNNITDEHLRELWDKHPHCAELAKHLNVSRSTVWRWLKGIGVTPDRTSYRRLKKPDYGKFAQWLRDNPDIVLPRSIAGIVALTGLTDFTVRSYLKRRQRRQATQTREFLAMLFSENHALYDDMKRPYHPKAIKAYRFKVDPFSFKSFVRIELKYAGLRFMILPADFKSQTHRQAARTNRG